MRSVDNFFGENDQMFKFSSALRDQMLRRIRLVYSQVLDRVQLQTFHNLDGFECAYKHCLKMYQLVPDSVPTSCQL